MQIISIVIKNNINKLAREKFRLSDVITVAVYYDDLIGS